MTLPTSCRLAFVLAMAWGALVLGQPGLPTTIAAHLTKLPPFPPVDEARQDFSLEAVRNEVLHAVRAKDTGRLMALISDSFAFGDERRSDHRFRFEQWLVEVPHADDWVLLDRALSLGGAFTTTRGAVEGRREFCAPYVFARSPTYADVPEVVRGEVLPWATVAKQVAVHAKPDLKSAVLGYVSYVLVQGDDLNAYDPSVPQLRWQVLRLPDDEEAYVRAETIYDPEGPSVCFAKVSSRWMVSAYRRRSTVGSR
jgi:hypothetical protein